MSRILILTTPSESKIRGAMRSSRNTVTVTSEESSPCRQSSSKMTPDMSTPHPKRFHYTITPKRSSSKRTPSSAAATNEKSSVYERLYSFRKSPTKGSELHLVHNSGKKSPESYRFHKKTKEGELRTRAKRLVILLQELKSHPRFLKHAPSKIRSDDSADGCYNVVPTPARNKSTSSAKKYDTWKSSRASSWAEDTTKHKYKDDTMKKNVACTHIQRIYRGYCTMTLLATISVIYATIIIQSAYRRHREFISARAIQCVYRKYISSQCYQLRIIKKFLEDSKKNEKHILQRIFSQYW